MVDTTDSKSVASNRVRVQVSSPVSEGFTLCEALLFLTSLLHHGLELVARAQPSL